MSATYTPEFLHYRSVTYNRALAKAYKHNIIQIFIQDIPYTVIWLELSKHIIAEMLCAWALHDNVVSILYRVKIT